MTSSATAPKRRPGLQKGMPSPRQAHNDKFHNFKVCRTCKEEKRLADFALTGNWRKKRAADPKRYKLDCKKCCRAPSATEVDPNFKPLRIRKPRTKNATPEQKRAAAAAYKRQQRRDTRIKSLEYVAEKGCCECGERDPRVLEFDHIDPSDKLYDISKLFANGYSWGAEKLREEIRKCRVICANCHRKHTIIQQEYYAHEDVRAALRRIYDHHGIEESN